MCYMYMDDAQQNDNNPYLTANTIGMFMVGLCCFWFYRDYRLSICDNYSYTIYFTSILSYTRINLIPHRA